MKKKLKGKDVVILNNIFPLMIEKTVTGRSRHEIQINYAIFIMIKRLTNPKHFVAPIN